MGYLLPYGAGTGRHALFLEHSPLSTDQAPQEVSVTQSSEGSLGPES